MNTRDAIRRLIICYSKRPYICPSQTCDCGREKDICSYMCDYCLRDITEVFPCGWHSVYSLIHDDGIEDIEEIVRRVMLLRLSGETLI
jgi:hypothetical protein